MDAFDESDFESFSEASSEEQDDIFSIYSGQAQSILSSLEDSIGKIDDFLSFERGYVHGDIVCAVEDPSGQMGRVVNVNMLVDLENVFGKVILDVDARELARILSISVGDFVINGPWLGRVDRVVDCVGIVFDDGTKCEIMVTDPEMLIPVSANLLDDSLPYHPGQRVKVGLSFLPRSSRWLCGMSRKNHQEGTICSVEAGSVYVDWLASALCGLSRGVPPPFCIQDPKNLTVLSCFPHSNWQLGDWCALPASERSIEANSMYKGARFKEHKSNLLGGMLKRDFSSKLEGMFVIVKRRSKVDVVWQDGSQSIGLDSCTLFPVGVVNASDFFPEQLVLEKASCHHSSVSDNERWGVVKYVDATERTVKVEWKTITVDKSGLDGKLSEEMVSAYELLEHPDFTFSFGDIVFLLEKGHFVGQTNVSTMREMAMLQPQHEIGDSDENPMRGFLSSIGYVTGFGDGDIQVQWASGTTTKVAPYEIIRVDKDDGSLSILVFHEDVSESNHEPAVEQEKQSLQHRRKDSSNVDYVNEVPQEHNGNTHFFGFSHAAIGFFTKMATNFFGSHVPASQEQPMTHSHMLDGVEGENRIIHGLELLEYSTICTEAAPMVTTDLDDHRDATLKQELERTPPNGLLSSCHQEPEQFKQFDIVGDCSDHHFVDGVGKRSALFQAKRGWLKKVQQEWSILEQDLPETIYIRIYEERMDLIRAVIVGASGTPYHDGLFFFDIFLPPDYPNEPPLVHYHSGGLRLNPNLYESGRVCLSLLNTWTGTGSEVWNPTISTILQVLLSLQALVLNDKPYFNEAGYDKQVGSLEGEKNSFSYNENAFLVTCKSMLYHLRKPPKHFEGLVEEHFRRRSGHILSACKHYMEGAPVGSFGSQMTGAECDKGNSRGFKIMLAKLFPLLVETFSGKGIDCSQFTEP